MNVGGNKKKMSSCPSFHQLWRVFFFFLILTLFSPRAFCQYYWELLESTPLSFHGLLKEEKKNMPPRDSNEEKPLSKKKPPLNWSLFMYNVIAIEYYFFLVVLPSIVSVCFLALFSYNTFLSFFFLFGKCICENGEFSISKDNT